MRLRRLICAERGSEAAAADEEEEDRASRGGGGGAASRADPGAVRRVRSTVTPAGKYWMFVAA